MDEEEEQNLTLFEKKAVQHQNTSLSLCYFALQLYFLTFLFLHSTTTNVVVVLPSGINGSP